MDNEAINNVNSEQENDNESNETRSEASEMINTLTSNGVTKEELKSVLTELFADKSEDISATVDKYILGLKGDGIGGEK